MSLKERWLHRERTYILVSHEFFSIYENIPRQGRGQTRAVSLVDHRIFSCEVKRFFYHPDDEWVTLVAVENHRISDVVKREVSFFVPVVHNRIRKGKDVSETALATVLVNTVRKVPDHITMSFALHNETTR